MVIINIQLDKLQVISETIFPSCHLTVQKMIFFAHHLPASLALVASQYALPGYSDRRVWV